MGTYSPDGRQKLRTYSYGPGEVALEIWKLDDNEAVNFYSKNEKGDEVPNVPALKIAITIVK